MIETFQQLIQLFWARRKLLIAVELGTVLLGVVFILVVPRQYTATADIIVDVRTPDALNGLPVTALMAASYMSTQIDVIRSRRVARKVVQALALTKDDYYRNWWQSSTSGEAPIEPWLVEKLLRKVDVEPGHDSNVVTLTFGAPTPDKAALIANAWATAYVETNLELRIDPATTNAAYFKEKTAALGLDLERAQNELTQFQQKNGLVAVTPDRLDFETNRLNELATQFAVVQAQGADSNSKQQRTEGSADVLPEVMQSPLIQSLKVSIAQNEARLRELAGRVGENYPDYKQLKSETQDYKDQLTRQIEQFAASVALNKRVGDSKVEELRQQLETQKRKVLDLQAQRDKMAPMQRNVDAASRAYAEVTNRASQTSLESHLSVTNASVLSVAAPPTDPSRPRTLLYLAIAVVFGGLLGGGIVLLQEQINRRIRWAGDISGLVGVPVLAVLLPMPVLGGA